MSRKRLLTRRQFLQSAAAGGALGLAGLGGCDALTTPARVRRRSGRRVDQRVVVIGLDGLDPYLTERLMEAGRLPNLAALRAGGGYSRLATSIPPQSPVAWASFITGADPGTHGIFDFIHRRPDRPSEPRYSAAETIAASGGWEVGRHRLPLSFWPFNHEPSRTVLRREGTPFWHYLDEAGIPSVCYDLPADYPPSPSEHGHHRSLAGMGTPDLLGTYGTHQVFSTRVGGRREESGGLVHPLWFDGDVARAKLAGPKNTLLRQPSGTEAEMVIFRHPREPEARIEIADRTVVLRQGEWSRWVRVVFPIELPSFLPNDQVQGICRFYLQEVRPHFRLYVSPLNIDPLAPGRQPVSEPPEFVTELADRLGRFGTLGFQEDHKALTNGVFSDEEFRVQADFVLEERLKLLEHALADYDEGLLFFYFSSTDLQAHMFWWDSDERHPRRSPAEARHYMGVLEDLYARLDGVVGDIARRCGPRATLLVLSDHGFGNFRRQFNPNTWLRDHGYLGPPDCGSLADAAGGAVVDWRRTRAYALGLNSVYLNLAGRERDGVVRRAERDALLEELSAGLLAARDPATGQSPIAAVYRGDRVYSGPCVASAPDLIIGYRRGYRCSWGGALGVVGGDILSDNDSAWAADHCMAAEELPGVLFCNRPLRQGGPSLIDLAPTILGEFGLSQPAAMTGRHLLSPQAVA